MNEHKTHAFIISGGLEVLVVIGTLRDAQDEHERFISKIGVAFLNGPYDFKVVGSNQENA